MLELFQQSALIALCVGAVPLLVSWLVITAALRVARAGASVYRFAARRLTFAREVSRASASGAAAPATLTTLDVPGVPSR